MNNLKVLAYLCTTAVLAACSQPEPAPIMMSSEPVYNKMGDVVGCTDGRTYVPGTAPTIDPCAPPSEECDPNLTGTAAPYCPPPREGKHDDTDTGRQPSTAG